jgi:predicted nucleotidyltransferase
MKLPTNKGNVPWLNDRVIFLTKAGSHAYGTSVPTSDLDLRGVAIAPKEYYFGFLQRFEQAIFKEPDAVVYDLQKFMKLAADANPSVLEILFTDPGDHLVTTPLGDKLIAARHLFLSKKARYSFVGYAMSQLKRIKTHRKWLLSPAEVQPKRSDFGLSDHGASIPKEQLGAINAMVRAKLDSWEVMSYSDRVAFREKIEQSLSEMGLGSEDSRFAAASRVLGFDVNFLDLLQRERAYEAAHSNWRQYQEWKTNRNPDRAVLEAKTGYDCKHALHLVRLCRMGREVLERGEVIVKRPDAEELLAIRNGAWTYEELISWAEDQERLMDDLYRTSTAVPKEPNRKALDALCVELLEEAFRDHGFSYLDDELRSLGF